MSRLLDMVRTRLRGMLGLGVVTAAVGYAAGVVWGFLIGAAIPVLSTLQLGGLGLLTSTMGHLIGEIGLLAAVGGLLSTGLVAIAQRDHRRDLAVVDEVAALAAPDAV